MKNKMVVAIILLFVFSSCQKQDIERDLQEAANAKGVQDELLNEQDAGTKSFKQVVLNLRAHLSGDEEVPPVETSATGQAIFQLSKDVNVHTDQVPAGEIRGQISQMIRLFNKKAPRILHGAFFVWCHLELNQGHTDFQSVALPTELWHLDKGMQIYEKKTFFKMIYIP
jgi:hypothetical protein